MVLLSRQRVEPLVTGTRHVGAERAQVNVVLQRHLVEPADTAPRDVSARESLARHDAAVEMRESHRQVLGVPVLEEHLPE